MTGQEGMSMARARQIRFGRTSGRGRIAERGPIPSPRATGADRVSYRAGAVGTVTRRFGPPSMNIPSRRALAVRLSDLPGPISTPAQDVRGGPVRMAESEQFAEGFFERPGTPPETGRTLGPLRTVTHEA